MLVGGGLELEAFVRVAKAIGNGISRSSIANVSGYFQSVFELIESLNCTNTGRVAIHTGLLMSNWHSSHLRH